MSSKWCVTGRSHTTCGDGFTPDLSSTAKTNVVSGVSGPWPRQLPDNRGGGDASWSLGGPTKALLGLTRISHTTL